MTVVNLDLGVGGLGDGQADAVIVNGTAGDDSVNVAGTVATGVAVTKLAAGVNITHSEGSRPADRERPGRGGRGRYASGLAAGLIHLTLKAGPDDL